MTCHVAVHLQVRAQVEEKKRRKAIEIAENRAKAEKRIKVRQDNRRRQAPAATAAAAVALVALLMTA